jgi:4-hydroxy-tetrahydrodipicolinate synthase
MLCKTNLKGNWETLLLPINEDESIDFGRLGIELDKMIEANIDGIYSNGTAGEFYNQTENEYDKIQELLAHKCKEATMPFQIGASHPSPIFSLERIKRTLHLKPNGYQIILPDWLITSTEEQIDYLEKLADVASGIPLILYNPPHAKSCLSPKQLKYISDTIPSIIGIKVAGGDDEWFEEMAWSIDTFSVFVPGHLLASGFQSQVADGAYSNVACIHPKGAQIWWEMIQNDILEALKVQQKILNFFDEVITPLKNKGYSNPALDKILATIGDWAPIGTKLRWPYKWLSNEEIEPMRKVAKRHLPNFLLNIS